MHLNPEEPSFAHALGEILGEEPNASTVDAYRRMVREARDAGLPLEKPVMNVDDFFPEKRWDVIALCGYMRDDPYSGSPGVAEIAPNVYRTTVRLTTPQGDKRFHFFLRVTDSPEHAPLVFNPLLNRFFYGEDFRRRAVKISDSGRIRNELQTLCSDAIEHLAEGRLRVRFDRIPNEVISPENQQILLEVLRWYKEHHPIWFRWLEIVPRSHRG